MNHVNIRLIGADVLYREFLPPQLVHFLVWNGQLGVQMFFTVSAFLRTSIAVRPRASSPHFPSCFFSWLPFAGFAPLLLFLPRALGEQHLPWIHHFVGTKEMGGLGRALLAALTFHVNV